MSVTGGDLSHATGSSEYDKARKDWQERGRAAAQALFAEIAEQGSEGKQPSTTARL